MSWLKLVRRIGGTIIFIIGVFSLVLPIVPGWLLIVIGLYLLSIDSPGLARRFEVLCARYPFCERLHTSTQRLFGHLPKTEVLLERESETRLIENKKEEHP